ncbi:MAG TPA: TIGR01777 family oxidoreductase, partial [Egibacteraceae bacterium]|nr:TIGR01777 family oxidoreductase [Egibacteraceae bacterium]
AVVHLAGEPIAGRRWTRAHKRRIRDSRVLGTRLLAGTLAGLAERPTVLVCASGMNYYGDRGDEVLTEDSPPGQGFLADVCREWEAAADRAREAGIRVVHLRNSLALSPRGGALGRILPLFKFGVGGRLGSGRQYWSWVSIDDATGIIAHALTSEGLDGPVNTASPNPVRNAEFTRTLATVLRRPALVPVPAWSARLALGEMADELLLGSARLAPERLQADGYGFHHPLLEPALRALLGRHGV